MPVTLLQTVAFDRWLRDLRDARARSRIAARLIRLEEGNAGLTRSVGDGIFELKIDYGPGYRVYYLQRGAILIVVLCGGDKSTQSKDIERAKEIAARWKENVDGLGH